MTPPSPRLRRAGNVQSNPNDQLKPAIAVTKVKYDLEERTTQFSEQVINFTKRIPVTPITKPLISQLIRSATSISANYCEADEANSKKDFTYKIAIAKKESRETKHWLRLIAHTLPEHQDAARNLWKEAQELNLILAAIIRSANQPKTAKK